MLTLTVMDETEEDKAVYLLIMVMNTEWDSDERRKECS